MPAERRRLLVTTAAAEFAASGYEHASLNRIIRRCSMSKSSFYHVIDSKQALFNLVVTDLMGSIRESADIPEPASFAGGRFWGEARALFESLAAAVAQRETFLALGRMFYLSGTPDDARGAINTALIGIEDWVGAVLEVGRDGGTVRVDIPASLQRQLVFAVLRTLDEWTVTEPGVLPTSDYGRLLEAQLGIIRRLLQPDT